MVEQATNDGEQATILCCSLIFPAESPVSATHKNAFEVLVLLFLYYLEMLKMTWSPPKCGFFYLTLPFVAQPNMMVDI